MSEEQQQTEAAEKSAGEIEPMQEDHKPRIKNITERQAENLKLARQRKAEIKLEKDKLDSTMNNNLKYIYNRLENIDSKIASLGTLGKRKEHMSDEDFVGKKKKKEIVEVGKFPTLTEQLFYKGVQFACVSVAVFTFGFAKNLIQDGYARYRQTTTTMDNEPATYGLPMV
jgi:hypothetical protein